MATFYGSWGSKSQSWGTSRGRLILVVTENRNSNGMTETFSVDVKFENNHSISYKLNLRVDEYREDADPYEYTRKNSNVSISTPSGGSIRTLYSYTSGDFSRFTYDRTIRITATLESCQFYPQLTVTASFVIPKRDSWTIRYVGGGATSGSVSSQTKWRGTDLKVQSNGFTRDNYSFDKWKASNGTMYSPGDTYSYNSGTTMTAQWTLNSYTIIYNANGGSGTMQNTTAIYGNNIQLRKNEYSKTGYIFNGWATTNTATTAMYTNEQTVKNLAANNKNSITLYAVWKPITYSIEYVSNGASGKMDVSSHVYDVSKNLSRNTYIFAGYDFKNWKDSNGIIYTDSQNVINLTTKNNEIIKLTAEWAPHVFEEKYDYNINELDDKYLNDKDKEYLNKGIILSQNVSFNSTYQLPKVDNLSCYNFLGWYNEKGEKVGDNNQGLIEYKTPTNRTLYAQWKFSGIPIYYYVGNKKVKTGQLSTDEITKLYDLPDYPGKKLDTYNTNGCWILRETKKGYKLSDELTFDNFKNYIELNFDAVVVNTTMKYKYIEGNNVILEAFTSDDYFTINAMLNDGYVCWKYGDNYYFNGDLFPNIATALDEENPKKVFQFTAVSSSEVNFIITSYKDIAEDFKQYRLKTIDNTESYSLSNSLFYYEDTSTRKLTNQPEKGKTYYIIVVNDANGTNIENLSFPLQPNLQFEGWADLDGNFITDNEGRIKDKEKNNEKLVISNLSTGCTICKIMPKFNIVSESYIVKTQDVNDKWNNLYTTMWVNNNNFSNSLIYPYKLGKELDIVIGTFEFNTGPGFDKGTLTGYK